MTVKLLTEQHFEFLSLKGDCTGSSEPTLVKMPHCWKARVAAQLLLTDIHSPIGLALANSAKFVESDHGCAPRIYFDNAGDNVTLTLYNVSLTSQKP